MARVRLLFALLLLAVGTSFGALAISGYYEPHMTHGQLAPAQGVTPQPADEPHLTLSQPRHRFLAIDDKPAPAVPAKPKAAAKAAPVKPKPAASTPPPARDRRPQQAAAQWPWDLFRN